MTEVTPSTDLVIPATCDCKTHSTSKMNLPCNATRQDTGHQTVCNPQGIDDHTTAIPDEFVTEPDIVSTLPGPTAVNSSVALVTVPASTASAVCRLCECIQKGELQRVNRLVGEMGDGEIDPDNRAIYCVIKYYQNYLNLKPNTANINKCDLWKMPNISQSDTRLQLLDAMRVLLKVGLDPNITTGMETPLMAAVRTHDESLILLLLKHGADPNLSDGREEMNAFALSIILNDVSVVEHLLHYGANINDPCCGSMTPLQLSMNKCVHISKLLLQGGADVQQVLQVSSPHNMQVAGPPLVQAVRSGNIYLASVLLEHGEDVNQVTGENSETSLHMAVKREDCEMVATLIQYGIGLNKLNGRGHSPFGLSLLVGGTEGNRIARLLLESGCSRKRETIISLFHRFYAPIFVACFRGREDIVDLLLQESDMDTDSSKECKVVCGDSDKTPPRGAKSSSVEELTEMEILFALKHNKTKSKGTLSVSKHKPVLEWEASDGSSPLMMAALGGHYRLVKHLLDLGADPHIICCHGNLAHAAVMSSSPSSMDLLCLSVRLGCNINLVNEQGNTPLHLSARINRSDMCLFLVEQGALLNLKDRFGETALSASVYFGCEDNSEVLIQHGADLDLADTSGTTALYWSIFNYRESTLRLLLSAGARFTPEQLSKYPRNLKVMKDPELVTFVRDQVCQPRSLLSLSVFKIRGAIGHVCGGRSIKDHVQHLPVPDTVKDRIMLVTHLR